MAPLHPLNSLSVLLSLTPLLPFLPLPQSSASIPPQMSPLRPLQQDPHHRTSLLAPILTDLGFQELSMAVPALYSPVLSSWSGPITLFAPSDDSIRSCTSCSAPRLLREHLVPGLFSRDYLSKLAFGTKLETASPGRCLTITSTNYVSQSNSSGGTDLTDVKIFVDGVEITRPGLFNDGQLVIHGIHGFVAPLSPTSCAQESIPSSHEVDSSRPSDTSNRPGTAIMRLMLRDAIYRLREGGFSILSLAMRVKYEELAGLNNMTVFALDDSAIFSGGQGYLTDVRFHIVPNRILMHSDLISLRHGMVLPTLVLDHHLVVTQAAPGLLAGSVRINYVPIKGFNVVYNSKIVVHSIFLPFPHLYLADLIPPLGTEEGGDSEGSMTIRPAFSGRSETCGYPNAIDAGGCPVTPASAPTISAVIDPDEGV